MNCHELNSDIEQLKSLRDELRGKVGEATETGLGKVAIMSAFSEAENKANELIEKYLEDIVEANLNDSSSRNSAFLDTILETELEKLNQSESKQDTETSESLITKDTTIDEIRSNLETYLESDPLLSSNLLTYALKEKLSQAKSTSLIEALDPFIPNSFKSSPKLKAAYLHRTGERIKNLEVLETKSYIFMLPKDKWNEGRIKLPNPENNSEAPEYIAPNDLTAILKSPVYYYWSYETDGRRGGNTGELVYDQSWVGKEIHHFPWSKELIQEANENLLKPNGYHIPIKDELKAIYNNTKNELAKERNTSPEDIRSSDITTAFIERFNLAFSGYVVEGELEYVGKNGYFWSASEVSEDYACCLYLNSGRVNPESWSNRSVAQSVRCVA